MKAQAVSDQDRIWDYWQNASESPFAGAFPRLHFLARRIRPGTRALNIGIGDATLERMLIGKGVEVYSIDPSEGAIAKANQFMNGNARVGRIEAIDFEDGFFDTVVMSEVLEHLDEETAVSGLCEVRRVLAPNGRFIGTVPDNERLSDNEVICPCCGNLFHRWGHLRSFDATSLQGLLSGTFATTAVESQFFSEPLSAGPRRWISGKLKSLASYLRLGPYGTARNLFFSAKCQ